MSTHRGRRLWLSYACAVLLMASAALPAAAVTTKDLASGLTAEQLAAILTGSGVTITNVKVTGANNAIGSFDGGSADGLSIDSGMIMSTGDIKTAAGPNTSQGTTATTGGPTDPDLDKLIPPNTTKDAVIFEFDAITTSPTFSIRYIFASEEYKEYVNSPFNDVFAFFVDGQNIAVLSGTTVPVSVNSINHLINTSFYRDNPPGSNNFGSSFDGFTTELLALGTVTPGVTHHIKIAIADATDTALDSAVFIAKGGISGAPAAAVVPAVFELLTTNLQTDEFNVDVFGLPANANITMSATGLPEDSSVTFTKVTVPAGQAPRFKMKVTIGPDTIAGFYPVEVRATSGSASAVATVLVIVDCTPPIILGIPGSQPASTTTGTNGRATLTVNPVGTLGLRYQWYQGHTGSTAFPIAGANSSTLTTPVVTTPTEFWVQVSNACGSRDSASALVTPR